MTEFPVAGDVVEGFGHWYKELHDHVRGQYVGRFDDGILHIVKVDGDRLPDRVFTSVRKVI